MSQSNNSSNNNNTILCIPGVFANIKEERIRRIFTELDIGNVVRIDIVVPKIQQSNQVDQKEKEKGKEKEKEEKKGKQKQFNRVFVHIEWNETKQSVICRKKLSEGKEVKVVYDEPWFWKVSAYRPPAPKEQPKPRKARLEIEDDEETFEPNVNYSGIIAPALIVVPPVIAPALTVVPPVIAPALTVVEDNMIQYDEFGEEIKVEQIDYKSLCLPAEPPRRRKPVIVKNK
jgi:hypothetical protein